MSLFDDHGPPGVADGTPRPLARTTDPDTSRDAAEAIHEREGGRGALRPGTQKAILLGVYGATGEALADFEAAARCDLYRAHVCYWHRVGDLVDDGYLVDTGQRRRNPDTGKDRRVLRITAEGRRALTRLTTPTTKE